MLKNRTAFVLSLAAGLAVSTSAMAQTAVQWVAGVSDSWGTAARWSPAQIPDNAGPSTFNVTLPNYGVLYTVTLDTTRDVTHLTMTGTAQDTVLDLNGSTLDVIQNFAFTRAYVAGNGGTNKVRVGGTATFNDGMFMWADFESNGSVVFAGSTTEEFCDTGFDHNGTSVAWTGTGDINFAGGSVFDHGAASTFTISHAGNNDLYGSGIDSFINAGNIIKSGGTGITTIRDIAFNNTGTIKVLSGELRFKNTSLLNGGSLDGGKFEVDGGAAMRVVDSGDVDQDITNINAEVTLRGASSSFASLNALQSVGTTGKLTLESGRVFTTAAALENNGTILLTQGGTLELSGGGAANSFNTGTIEASSSGVLRVKTGAVLNVTGTLKATDSGIVEFESGASLANVVGSTLVGGNFEATEGGVIRGNALAGVTRINSSVLLSGAASDLLDGGGNSILPNISSIGSFGQLTLNGRNVVLLNNLTVEGSANASGNITVEEGTTVELASGRTITNFSNGTFSNGRFTIRGEIVADDLEIDTINTSVTLDRDGGRLRNRTTGLDALNSLSTLGANADVTVANGRDLITLGALTALPGSSLQIGASLGANRTTVSVFGDFNANGNILMNGGEIVTPSNVILAGRLGGNGLISSDFINRGQITPGFSPGLLQIDGNFQQTQVGLIEFEIGGSLAGIDHDFLQVRDIFRFGDGSNAAGTALISLINGFVPADGQSFTLISSEVIFGNGFSEVGFLNLPSFVTAELVYRTNGVDAVFRHVPAPGPMASLLAASLLAARRRRS